MTIGNVSVWIAVVYFHLMSADGSLAPLLTVSSISRKHRISVSMSSFCFRIADNFVILLLLQQVGRLENAIGWYHSHPGYGCWLSGIDVSTQMLNQQFQEPFVAIVVSCWVNLQFKQENHIRVLDTTFTHMGRWTSGQMDMIAHSDSSSGICLA